MSYVWIRKLVFNSGYYIYLVILLQFQIYVLPESEKVLEYNLYPLIAGSVVLPKFKVTISENGAEGLSLQQEHLDLLIERALPKYLYIMVRNFCN